MQAFLKDKQSSCKLITIQTKNLMPSETPDSSHPHPSFWEAFRFWVKLGFISFGGPTGQIAIMHHELVERKKWIGENRFLHALNFCMLLPGPEATQLAIYIGWLLHRTLGGLVAGAFFVIPSIFILWTLSFIYMAYGKIPWISSVFYGLKPAVIAIVAFAVIRIGKKALKNEVMWGLAVLSFVAIYYFHFPFPAIILSAGLIGLLGEKLGSSKFRVAMGHSSKSSKAVLDDHAESPSHTKPSFGRALKVLLIFLILWWAPIVVVGLLQGWNSTLFHEGLFFSKAAMVTFGGAYAVLPYVAQRAVENFNWLNAGQMLDGLGLAETTPGPLIMVLQFVGFLGGWNHPEGLPNLLSATLGALLTTWVTFVPCFLWIFLGAPYIETMRGNHQMGSALAAITAAVVGVIFNLAIWFALQVLFPGGHAVDWFAVVISIIAFVGLWKWQWNLMAVVFTSGFLGWIWHFSP
jgi:chromate transporter